MSTNNLTALLHDSGWALNQLEEKLSNHIGSDQFGVGDIMLKHLEFKERQYGVWLIGMEDGTLRAYDTYEECEAVHQYRGLPARSIFDLDDRVMSAEKLQEIIKAVQHMSRNPMPTLPDKIFRPETHVRVSSIMDPPTSFDESLREKLVRKFGMEDFFSTSMGTSSKDGKI